MEKCLAKNMIKEVNFPKIISDLSQMMLKLGKNIRWVEILEHLEKIDDIIPDSKV